MLAPRRSVSRAPRAHTAHPLLSCRRACRLASRAQVAMVGGATVATATAGTHAGFQLRTSGIWAGSVSPVAGAPSGGLGAAQVGLLCLESSLPAPRAHIEPCPVPSVAGLHPLHLLVRAWSRAWMHGRARGCARGVASCADARMRVVRRGARVVRARMCVRMLAAFVRRRVLPSGLPAAAAATVAASAAASPPSSGRARPVPPSRNRSSSGRAKPPPPPPRR